MVPYMTIVSPTAETPTDAASAHASTVPAVTGVPAASPVSRAASSVILPAISSDQSSRGSSSPGATTSHQSRAQSAASRSYIGSHWLAEWWSSTYSPVRRCTRNELAMRKRSVACQTSGSWRCSHRHFGPTAWLDNGVPPRARMASAPSSSVSFSISRVARVSTP